MKPNRSDLFICLFCLLTLPALAQRIDVPLDLRGKSAVVDADAAKGKCLAANIEEKSGTLMGVRLPPLSPGVYRAHARLKISHTCVQATARLAFSVRIGTPAGGLGERGLTIVDFERARQYQDIVVPIVVTRPVNDAAIAVSWQWEQSRQPRTAKRQLNDMAMPSATNLDLDAAGTSTETVTVDRPLSELAYYLACDGVWLERVGEAIIETLRVDKNRYVPGETAHISGRVRNASGKPANWTLQAERIDELDPAGVLASTTLSVDARGTTPFTVEMPVGDRLWGHAVRCTLRDATQGVVAVASEPFAVHTNFWAVLLGSRTMDHTDYRVASITNSSLQDDVYRAATEIEFVFWAPDDFGGLTPTNHYWSGQMRRENGADSTRALVDHFHGRGIGCAVYTKICTAGGKAGYELMRQHPEWLTPSFYDVAQLDRWERSQRLSCWPMLTVNAKAEDAYRHHAREIIVSQRRFGWDAVRYDSFMNEPDMPRLFGMVKATVNAACPGFQWGYNSGPPDGYAPGMFDLMCAGGGLIMEERNTHAMKDGWTYEKYADRHLTWRGWVHPRGGHLTFCPFETELVNDAIYQEILPLCARAHQAWDATKGRDLGADYRGFSLRYAGQVWDANAVALTNAAALIEWGPAATNLFFRDRYAYVRPTGPDRGELILHMVNRPPPVVCRGDTCWVAPPLEGVTCKIRVPAGIKLDAVQCLSPEQDPGRQELAVRHEDGASVFTVPKLRFWNMLVIPFSGNGRWL